MADHVSPYYLGFTRVGRPLLATRYNPTVLALSIAAIALVALPAKAYSAEEMAEAEAILEIKRLHGRVGPAMFTREEALEMEREGHAVGRERLLDVRFAGEEFGDEQLKLLKYLPATVRLGISNCDVTDAGIKELKSLPMLTSLTFSGRYGGTKLTDNALREIGEIKTLKKLYLNRAQIAARGFESLSKLDNMQVLMADGPGIDDEAVGHLRRLRKLKTLSLSETSVSNAGLIMLKDLPNLISLELLGCNVDDRGLGCLRDFPAIQSFDVRGDRLTQDALDHLRGLSRITSLGIGGQAIGDSALGGLLNLPNLVSLSLNNDRRVTDEGLRHLAVLKKLQWLNLSRTAVTDDGLPALLALPSLTDLNLSFTAVTDDGLDTLKQIKTLRSLVLPGEVTTEAIQRFREQTGVQVPGR